jgi:8-oxo-dGTP diphosphatase
VSEPVRAAGGVVFRTTAGDLEVLLVYRARYGDWTFPKGHADDGETDQACALREVEEETGLRCIAGDELPGTGYRDRRGRDKRVRYWVMRPVAGEAGPRNEIDAVRWAPLPVAADLLTHERDRRVLRAFAQSQETSA